MNLTLLFILSIIAASSASIYYVYNLRGEVRYASFREYLRKAWPIFAPLNCFLYLTTRRDARDPFLSLEQFPELKPLVDNWETIRDEAVALMNAGTFAETTREDSSSYYDVGFRTFYKYGWSKFYVKWYGDYLHPSAQRLCPRTAELVSRIPNVNGTMFTLLPPGGQLTRHCDPMACSFRFHLGLDTPNSDACFINVDGKTRSWRNGDAFLFDETYLHFVRNDTDHYRLILMCDVERPMNLWGRLFNSAYKWLMQATLVPNTPEDKRGLFNWVFSKITPLMAWGKQLKKTNRRLYKTLEYTLNGLLLALLLLLLASPTLFFN